jgi:hypothetical protein
MMMRRNTPILKLRLACTWASLRQGRHLLRRQGTSGVLTGLNEAVAVQAAIGKLHRQLYSASVISSQVLALLYAWLGTRRLMGVAFMLSMKMVAGCVSINILRYRALGTGSLHPTKLRDYL